MPSNKIFSIIEEVGISAVEVYSNKNSLQSLEIIDVCKQFDFEYVLHAPNDIFAISDTFNLAKSIDANLIVAHDLFWEDEWKKIMQISKDFGIPLAIENTDGFLFCEKVIRRYNAKRCIDFEHLTLQTNTLTPTVLNLVKPTIKDTIHVHMTGYKTGNGMHHSHFYKSPIQSERILKFLLDNKYNEMAVSEAAVEYQTKEHFQKLKVFYDNSIEKIFEYA